MDQSLGQLNGLNHQFENIRQLLIKLKEPNSANHSIDISNYDLECLLNSDFDGITEDQQVLFNYIKSKEISVINFKNNSQIDIGIIKQFNLNNVVILDLSGCDRIVYFEGILSTTLNFKSLIKIKFNNCTQLVSIKINAPNLEYISAENCKLLEVFKVDSSLLKYCSLKGSLSSLNIPSTGLDILNNDRLEYLNISESDYGGEITINSKSLKRLIMNSMNKLSRIKLQVPSIESFSFEGCESLNEISTIKRDKELNYNLWNVLQQMGINQLKEMNITINMVAAEQIYDLNQAKDYYILIPASGVFIIPYNAICSYYFRVPTTFTFGVDLPASYISSFENQPVHHHRCLSISGDFSEYSLFYDQSFPVELEQLYLYDTHMFKNTPELGLLVLGYGFKNEYTLGYQNRNIELLVIGDTLRSIRDLHSINNKVKMLQFDGYKYKIDTGVISSFNLLKFGYIAEPLVAGSIDDSQDVVCIDSNFNHVLNEDILSSKIKHLKLYSVDHSLLPSKLLSTFKIIEIEASVDYFNHIVQEKDLHSSSLVVFNLKKKSFKDRRLPVFGYTYHEYEDNYKLIILSGQSKSELHYKFEMELFKNSKFEPYHSILPKLVSTPSFYEYLHYWIGYDKPIIAGTIPQFIEYLYLCEVNHPLSVGSIPPSVTHLELCDGFNQQITKKGIIPSSVKRLVIGNIVHPLNQHSVPKELEVLELGINYRLTCNEKTLSPLISVNLKTLIIHGGHSENAFYEIKNKLSIPKHVKIYFI